MVFGTQRVQGGYLGGGGHWGRSSKMSVLCWEIVENGEWDGSVVKRSPGQVEKGGGSGWIKQY